MDKTYIDWDIFRKAVYSNLKGLELIEFDKWLEESPANKKYFEDAKKIHLEDEIRILDDVEASDQAWDEFSERQKSRKRKVYFNFLQKIAAFAVIGVFIFFAAKELKNYKHISLASNSEIIKPGRSFARLTIENGDDILLENTDTVFGLKESLSLVSVKSGRIDYNSGISHGDLVPVLNRVTIPQGGEYRVTLPDGSEMWVNSETMVEYYVPFIDGHREIYVSGEICMEVVKDSLHPFRVRADDFTVQVLGTTFNISAYPDDNLTTTTLVSGSVEIIDSGEGMTRRLMLEPDQQLVFDKISANSEIRDVDASAYTAWTRGFFVFDNETLYSIFSKLERWYDINVFFFSEEAENEYFTGKLPRFDNLEEILEIINQVSLSELTIKGKTVTIK